MEFQQGVRQGDPLGGVLFSITLAAALEPVHKQHKQCLIAGVYDDVTIAGPESADNPAETACYDAIVTATAAIGLELQPTKCVILRPAEADAETLAHIAAAAAKNLKVVAEVGRHGRRWVPLGADAFQQRHIEKTVDDFEEQMVTLIKVAQTPNYSRTHQTVLKIICLCLPTQLTYTLRVTPPSNTTAEARRLDNIIRHGIYTIVGAEGRFNSRRWWQQPSD